jgi:membrane carboxypeptidase/penicillin-binding protein
LRGWPKPLTLKRWAAEMRAIFKGLLLFATASGVAILGAAAIWVYPDVSSLRATFTASANSTYPLHVARAFLAAEDPYFLDDYPRRQRGAATLVQQMVKSEILPSRGIGWQLKEVLVAAVIERTVPKSQVVAAYLDNVYLGSARGKRLYGVPIGSRAYFGREPKQLTLAEAATLAGIVRSPHSYSPIEYPERAASRRQDILAKMRALKFITDAEFASAINRPATAPPN